MPDTPDAPLRLAILGSCWYRHSHADVILKRWFEPPATDAAFGFRAGRTRIASAWFDQLTGVDLDTDDPRPDLAVAGLARRGVPLHAELEDALVDADGDLAVDGVLIVAEHGDYPFNALGQHMYPRKAFFDRVAAVFERTGRAVPVFCDKHLSWAFGHGAEMVATARRLGFPLVAGSSIPHVPSRPRVDLSGRTPDRVVCVYRQGVESYGMHAMEYAQSFVEQRRGGEAGVVAITAFRGAEAVAGAVTDGRIDGGLLRAAEEIQPEDPVGVSLAYRAAGADPDEPEAAWVVEHADGLEVAYVRLLGKLHGGWSIAARTGAGAIEAGVTCGVSEHNAFGNFAALMRVFEDVVVTGRPSFPVERNLLVTGLLEAGMRARQRLGERVETPHLRIAYAPLGPRVEVFDGVALGLDAAG